MKTSREEQTVSIASKMYDARKTARDLMGDKYAESIAPHVASLRKEAKQTGKTILAVCIDRCKALADRFEDMAIMATLAATVEAIEEDGGAKTERELNEILNPKEPPMPEESICSTCADCVGGLCQSPSDTAQKLRATWRDEEKRDPPECDDYREAVERPGPDDEIEDRVLEMYERIEKSEEWGKFDTDTDEQHAQRRMDYLGESWKGSIKVMAMSLFDAYPTHGNGTQSGAVQDRMIRLLQECPELEKARDQKYRLTWRLSKWTDKGAPCHGQSKPIPQSTREKYAIKETWDLTLSLPAWLLLDETGRDRLLHHELMHPATLDRGHPVSEFPETVARFGVASKDQMVMAIAAIAHPRALETVERFGLLPARADGSRQLTMFAADGIETIEVRVPRRLEATPDRSVVEAIESMRPKPGSGIESVTLSSDGRSVTLKAKGRKVVK